jgi:integrase
VHTAWIVTYFDRDGRKRQETFERERDAKAREAEVKVNVAKGIHTPRSASPTVAEVGALWVEHAKLEGRERTTIKQYRPTSSCTSARWKWTAFGSAPRSSRT